jgi:hypothetical protein
MADDGPSWPRCGRSGLMDPRLRAAIDEKRAAHDSWREATKRMSEADAALVAVAEQIESEGVDAR